ncbi:MAG TPA: hypothetical protein VMH80_14650 [Bryobacteraceae bacterium]|nr:hypothetical protein [Bryobacteraceae bacterium]
MLAGTVTFELLLDSVTVVPPVGAFPLIVTVQFEVAGPVTVEGVQLRALTVTVTAAGTVIVPPELVVEIACPDGSEVDTPDKKTGIVPLAVFPTWRVTSARSPGEITLLFRPITRQVSEPAPLVHWSDLLAALAFAPTVALAEVMLEGKLIVNPNAAGCAPLLAENETDRFAVPPGAPDVELRPTETVCAARVEKHETSTNRMKSHNFI